MQRSSQEAPQALPFPNSSSGQRCLGICDHRHPVTPEATYPVRRPMPKNTGPAMGKPFLPRRRAYSGSVRGQDVLERRRPGRRDDLRDAMKQTDLMTRLRPRLNLRIVRIYESELHGHLVMQVIKGRHETVWPEKKSPPGNISIPSQNGWTESSEWRTKKQNCV